MTDFACLEAKMLGGAFVHEGWGELHDTRLIGLFDARCYAEDYAKMRTSSPSASMEQRWIVTDAHGGSQQVWNRARILRDARATSEQP